MGGSNSVLQSMDAVSSSSDLPGIHDNHGRQKGKTQYPTFEVSLGFWPGNHIPLPEKFKLKISYESLDFVRFDNELPIVQFPFQNIISWGSSPQNFQFKIFDLEKSAESRQDTGILISLKTSQGKVIEEATMSNVQRLMVDINLRALTREEFGKLLQTIFDEKGILKENWLATLQETTSTGKLFLAKQGMELLLKVSEQAPFEKFDLACFIYERMINKNSVQLLINVFEDPKDRDNLIHRLKLEKEKNQTIAPDCVILPEKPL